MVATYVQSQDGVRIVAARETVWGLKPQVHHLQTSLTVIQALELNTKPNTIAVPRISMDGAD